VSATARAALQARETPEVFLCLLTLAHPSWVTPIRVVNDGVGHTAGGQDYLSFPFDITMPPETEEGQPKVTLEICNVDRQIVAAVRGVSGDPITVELAVALASTPDVVEAGPYSFSLREASYDATVVSGTLAYEDLLNEPCPPRTMTPAVTPGLF